MGSQQAPPFHWHYADIDDPTASTYQLRGRTLFFVVILFAIILLASLLFFYARWVCYTRQSPAPFSSHNNVRNEARRRRSGLDAAVISSLPVLLYGSMVAGESDLEGGGVECCICLSLFEEDDKMKMLPECNHCFHSECVDRWLLTCSSCPLCRSSLSSFHQPPAATQIVIH